MLESLSYFVLFFAHIDITHGWRLSSLAFRRSVAIALSYLILVVAHNVFWEKTDHRPPQPGSTWPTNIMIAAVERSSIA